MTPTTTTQNSTLTPSKPSCLIDSCDRLILETYIQITLDGNHTRLGEGDTDAAWTKIQTEFDGLTGGTTQNRALLLARDINHLGAKFDLVKDITAMLRRYYVAELGLLLEGYGFHYQWELISEELYHKQLDSIDSQSKTWFVQMLAKKKEWEHLSEDGGSTKITREYFEDWLVSLSEVQGYNIDTNTITTYRFAVMLKKQFKQSNKTEAKNKK